MPLSISARAAPVIAHAVTTLPGQAGPGDDPLWLRRIGVDPDVDLLWFRQCAAAVKVERA
jgi:hypothetical protein